MQITSIIIRKLQLADTDAAMELSCDAGWNQTESDWKFLIGDPENICVAAIADGKVVGTTVALIYAGKLAWIGMVLVNKTYRGKGISKLLLQHVFDNCTVPMKLDATALGEPVYRKFGFEPEYAISRMVNLKLENTCTTSEHIPQPISDKHLSHVQALDGIVFGIERKKLLKYLQQQYPQKSWLLLDDNRVDGFVLGREGYRYHHIGPVVATTTEHAIALITHALQQLVGQAVVIDVLTDKKELIQFLQDHGFVEQRQFLRMYKGQHSSPDKIDFLFAIAGPEFG